MAVSKKRSRRAAKTAPKKADRLPLRLEYRSPAELAENPRNWRRHPDAQVAALSDVIAEVGWAGACLFNERTGRLIDGHARRKVAEANGADQVPVLVGSWSEEDERKILATFDPIGAMATTDAAALDELLRGVQTGSESVARLLAEIAGLDGEPLTEGWGRTEDNRDAVPKAVVAYLAIYVGDLATFEAMIAAAAQPGESPADTIRRGLDAIHPQG